MKLLHTLFIFFFTPILHAIPTGDTGTPGGEGGELPASEYYLNFDTTSCHYLQMEGVFLRAETQLTLTWNASCDYIHPFSGRVTSKFGKRRRRMHYGIDIDLETGDKVHAAFEGMVRYAKYNPSYGNLVVVRHPNGLETYYAHLSAIEVSAGDYIQAGQVVGLGGNTGRSYGAHLHFEVRFLGVPIDPALLIDFETGQLKYSSVILKKHKDRLLVENAARYHIVKPGEDIYSISRLYGVPVNEICRLNGISFDDPILLDMKLRYN
jgi:hypothetical protein